MFSLTFWVPLLFGSFLLGHLEILHQFKFPLKFSSNPFILSFGRRPVYMCSTNNLWPRSSKTHHIPKVIFPGHQCDKLEAHGSCEAWKYIYLTCTVVFKIQRFYIHTWSPASLEKSDLLIVIAFQLGNSWLEQSSACSYYTGPALSTLPESPPLFKASYPLTSLIYMNSLASAGIWICDVSYKPL